MAEENKAEGAPEGAPENSPPKKKVSPLLILLGAQMLVILVATGVIAKFVLFSKPIRYERKDLTERAVASIVDAEKEIKVFPLEAFTVTLPDKRTLKVQFKFEVSNLEIEEKLKDTMPSLRARILNVLSDMSSKDLRQLSGKLLLKDNVRTAVNEELLKLKIEPSKGIVREVYVSDLFLM